MDKSFDSWNKEKKRIDNDDKNILFHEWEICWTSLWVNIWNESNWKWKEFRRPVLVIKKLSRENSIVIPLSTKIKTWSWFERYSLHWIEYTALLYQIKFIITKRFTKREWELMQNDFNRIKKKLKLLLSF